MVKSSNGYKDINGYALGTANEDLTCNMTNDYRSYLQHPVIRMKSIINACQNPINNGGWELKLDDYFFHKNNLLENGVEDDLIVLYAEMKFFLLRAISISQHLLYKNNGRLKALKKSPKILIAKHSVTTDLTTALSSYSQTVMVFRLPQ